ncbi:MAG: dTMP kinase [Pontiella sp.]
MSNKRGLCCVFFGPDGCGKTSVAEGLKGALSGSFDPTIGLHCHWKPLPQKNGCIPREDPHALPARNALLSFVYFIHHYLPFLWGWWVHVNPVLNRGGMVIIDRYYYDFFVDLRRYRLNLSQWFMKLGFVFVKKPDLVFCLDADPEILQARKKEVSFAECTRQREAYRELADTLPNGHVIDASQSLDEVVSRVEKIVREYMSDRSAKWNGKS